MVHCSAIKRMYGFTIVELAVVIAVVGILAAITIASYGSWRQSSAETAVKSDLSGAYTALESHKNFNDSFPATLPTTFTSSEDVTLSYNPSADGTSYCVSARSDVVTTVVFNIQSLNGKTPVAGAC